MLFFRAIAFFLLTSIASVAAVPISHAPTISSNTVDVYSPAYWKEKGVIPVIGIRNGRIVLGPDFKPQQRLVKGLTRLTLVMTAPVLAVWWLREVHNWGWRRMDEIHEWISVILPLSFSLFFSSKFLHARSRLSFYRTRFGLSKSLNRQKRGGGRVEMDRVLY